MKLDNIEVKKNDLKSLYSQIEIDFLIIKTGAPLNPYSEYKKLE